MSKNSGELSADLAAAQSQYTTSGREKLKTANQGTRQKLVQNAESNLKAVSIDLRQHAKSI